MKTLACILLALLLLWALVWLAPVARRTERPATNQSIEPAGTQKTKQTRRLQKRNYDSPLEQPPRPTSATSEAELPFTSR